MTRSTHWLRRSRNVGFPRRQIALTVSWERVPRARSPTVADDVLSSWTAQEWSGGPGEEKWESSGSGYERETFWRWLSLRLQRKTSTWVWAYGMAHALTLLGFWEKITNGEASLARCDARLQGHEEQRLDESAPGLCVVNDPPTIVLAGLSGVGGNLRLLDVRNMGISEGHEEFGRGCTSDGLASWLQGWCRAVDQLKLGGLRHTAAAQAWHGWRHSYMGCGVLVHGNEEVSRLERASVHPGRAEAYRLGLVGGPVHHYDASSHYPSCAISGSLPVRLRWCGTCSLSDVRGAISRGWLCLCECRVRCARPLLPCRVDGRGRPMPSAVWTQPGSSQRHSADRTVWPVGEWTVCLPWPEVERGLDGGLDLSVMRAAVYEPGRPVDSFVSNLWEQRSRHAREGRRAESECCKLVMNSLVGKWAAHGHAWNEAPEALAPQDWYAWYAPCGEEGRLHRYRSIGWHVQREDVSDETPESIPALAAWTYSVGRVRLLDWIETAGWGSACYVDSDSIFVVGGGDLRLHSAGMVRQGTLGALRLQGVYPSLRIGGIRDYSAAGRTVRAGVPSKGTKEANGVCQWWREHTVSEAIGEHRRPLCTAVQVTIPVARTYRHGVVSSDGRISPLRVSEA